DERNLRQADEVRRILLVSLGDGRGGGQPANAAAHRFENRYRLGECADIHAEVARRLRHIARRAAVPGTAVRALYVVVDRLGNADDPEFVALVLAEVAERVRGAHAAIATDENRFVDVELAKPADNALQVLLTCLHAR